MERTWIRESSFNIEKGAWRCWGGGGEILCVCSGGFHKSVRSRGRAFRKIWPVLLALQPDHGILVKRNRNQLCDYIMTTEPARLAGIPVLRSRDAEIPGGNFSSNHACRSACRMKQARNSIAGNTLLMRIASNLYIKMAALGWPFSWNKCVIATWRLGLRAPLVAPKN